MNQPLNSLPAMQDNVFSHLHKEELEKHLTALVEWKRKAILQLEDFRTACILYKLCEVDKVNELLSA